MSAFDKNSVRSSLLKQLPAAWKRKFFLCILFVIMLAVFESLTLGVIALFASSLSSMGNNAHQFPVINFSTIDSGRRILFLSATVAGTVLVKNMAVALYQGMKARVSSSAEKHIGTNLLHLILDAPYQWHVMNSSSASAHCLHSCLHIGAYFRSLLQVILEASLSTIMLVVLIAINPLVSALLFVILGIVAIAAYLCIKRRIDRFSEQAIALQKSSFLHISKVLGGVRDIKLFQKESYFEKTAAESMAGFAAAEAKQQAVTSAPSWIFETAGFVLIAFTVLFMSLVLKTDKAAVFSFVAILAISAWRILPAVNRLVTGVSQIRTSIPFVSPILGKAEELNCGQIARERFMNTTVNNFHSGITVSHLTFQYEDREHHALRDVSLRINKGTAVGIVGPSGAGKSTLTDLLTGLIEPDSGVILVDDAPLAHVLGSWLKRIGYVSQEPFIHNGSIAENIAFGASPMGTDRDRLTAACSAAALDFYAELPDGLDTMLGDGGVNLSGGQRRRIAIARALYKDPEVLILDEATGFLDEKTEQDILSVIYGYKGKKTIIVISHKLTTVERCDHIIWLQDGRVKAQGSANTVLKQYRSFLYAVETSTDLLLDKTL